MLSFENRKKVFKGDNMTAATTGSTQKPYVSEQPKQEQPKKAQIKISFNGREVKPEEFILGTPITDKELTALHKSVNEAFQRFEKSKS